MRVLVTVTTNNDVIPMVLWNKVMMSVLGDGSDLKNLLKEFEAIKGNVNSMVNEKGIALKNVDIKIEFLK